MRKVWGTRYFFAEQLREQLGMSFAWRRRLEESMVHAMREGELAVDGRCRKRGERAMDAIDWACGLRSKKFKTVRGRITLKGFNTWLRLAGADYQLHRKEKGDVTANA